MAKRTVKASPLAEENFEPDTEPTEAETAEWAENARREREESLAPYRAVHEQQNDQDDLIAELLFEVDLLKLGIEE